MLLMATPVVVVGAVQKTVAAERVAAVQAAVLLEGWEAGGKAAEVRAAVVKAVEVWGWATGWVAVALSVAGGGSAKAAAPRVRAEAARAVAARAVAVGAAEAGALGAAGKVAVV